MKHLFLLAAALLAAGSICMAQPTVNHQTTPQEETFRTANAERASRPAPKANLREMRKAPEKVTASVSKMLNDSMVAIKGDGTPMNKEYLTYYGTLWNTYRFFYYRDGDWIQIESEERTFDEQDRVVAYDHFYHSSNGGWRSERTYDGDDYYLTYTQYELNGDAWERTNLYVYDWSDDHKSLSMTGYKYVDGDTVFNVHYAYTYDDRGNCIREDCEMLIDGVRTHYSTEEWTYDLWGNMLSDTYICLYSNERTVYTYDAAGHELSKISYYLEGEEWVARYKYIREYDEDGNMTEYCMLSMVDNVWVPDFKYVYTYDATGYCTGDMRYNYQNDAWAAGSYSEYSKNADGSIYTEENYNSDGTLYSTVYYYYSIHTDLETTDAAPRGQKLFRDGRILIRQGEHFYDLTGRAVE